MAGRGRGLKKPPQQQQQQQQGAGRGAPSYAQMGGGPAAAPPPQVVKAAAPTAWGPPAGASSRATHRTPAAPPGEVVTQKLQELSIGASGPAPAPSRGGNGNGGNGAAASAGRGSVRGARRIGDAPTRLLVTRPATLATKQGARIKAMNLLVNYFKIETVPEWVLHQYRVDIAPEEDRTRERKFLLRTHRDKLGGHLFDGTVLFTANRLTAQPGESVNFTSKNEETGVIYTITIKHVGQVDRGDYAYIQIYNLLMRTCLSALNLQLLGRDYYDPEARVLIPAHNLELWPGYKTSIRQHEKDILMCVEVTHKVLRNKTAHDILNECYRNNQNYYREDFTREMIGCIVITKYNNKTYRIDDIDWDSHPGKTFKFRDEEITYAAYMEKKYQLRIRDMKQPLLVSRAKARDVRAGMSEIVNLIPEVCYLTGLTDAMRADFRLMSALAEHTRVSPLTRCKKLMAFNNRLQNCEVAMTQLRKFDMTLGRGLVEVTGNKLPEEKILFGSNSSIMSTGEWNMNRQILLSPKSLQNWTLIVPAKFAREANAFVDHLGRAAKTMRLPFSSPEIVQLQRDNAGEYAQALQQILNQSQPQIIMCCVPNQRGDRYSAIKKKCCVERPVPTQVILTKNLNDPKKSSAVATKVAIQMNCKLGGAPWSVENPLKKTMVVGFDVCHDTANKSKSFGAMVASLDDAFSRYFSCVTPHSDGNELSSNFALNIVKSLRKFQEVNQGMLPTRILIFRDGVGEGQLGYVYDTELVNIRQKLAEIYGSVEPKLVFIIVTKRINSRVFTNAPTPGNPDAGTVVDDVITDPEKYDFFLIPQSVRQGTVSPVSYNVLFDSLGLTPEKLQRMTYKLCHMYYNWSGTVRVPAPCQYAHKLAFLVGQSIHQEPHAQLQDLLYFL